jgi:hypothetical protein
VGHDPRLGPRLSKLRHRLLTTLSGMADLTQWVAECHPASWTATERAVLGPLIRQAAGASALLENKLASTRDALEKANAA